MKAIVKQVLEDVYGKSLRDITYSQPFKSSHEVYSISFFLNDTPVQHVLKIFPRNMPVYKNSCLEKEVRILRGISREGTVRVPEIIYYDTRRRIDNREFFIMSYVQGIPMSELIRHASLEEKKRYVKDSAELIAHIHMINLLHFPFLSCENYARRNITRLEGILKEIERPEHGVPQTELEFMSTVFSYVRSTTPLSEESCLINGDLSTAHFIKHGAGYAVLDWDPAEIGDRCWDIFWMVKDLPEIYYGYPEAQAELIDEYECASKKPLKNRTFYHNLALAWALILGWFMEKKVPNHEAIPLIKICRPKFVEHWERMLSTYSKPAHPT